MQRISLSALVTPGMVLAHGPIFWLFLPAIWLHLSHGAHKPNTSCKVRHQLLQKGQQTLLFCERSLV